MITCPKCSKENQDHYKFCLGCGSELPRDAGAPQRSFSTPTPPAGVPVANASFPSSDQSHGNEPPAAFPQPDAVHPASVPEPISSDSAPPEVTGDGESTLAPRASMVPCPNCGTQNPSNFKFCGACGARLEDAAAPAAEPVVTEEARSGANLVLIRPDGSEGGVFPLNDGATTVGRSTGQMFSADAYLSPDHATFMLEGGRMMVRDEESLNGVYLRIPAENSIPIAPGDVVRMGQELVRIELLQEAQPGSDGTELMGSLVDGVWGRVTLIVGSGQVADAYPLTGEGVVLGRERGDVLFPEDGYVSGTHVRVQRQDDKILVTDLNSSNGTFLRVNVEQEINQGDYILMGQQLFRVDF